MSCSSTKVPPILVSALISAIGELSGTVYQLLEFCGTNCMNLTVRLLDQSTMARRFWGAFLGECS